MAEHHDLFLSYSHKNKRFIERLAADLREHHVDVWLDTIEIEVGDQVHLSIEQGIAQSRFFCLALSPASLASYYVRRVEYEAAFSRLIQEKRDSFILPMIIQEIKEPLPPRLVGLHYLNFTNRKLYAENMRNLVKKVRQQSTRFTGTRWYKALDISTFGDVVGVGEATGIAPNGASYCIAWENGIVIGVDVYYNGVKVNEKRFEYDAKGRVITNTMYEPDGAGGWHVNDDIWHYEYDNKTGRRSKKFMKKPGARSGRELSYDQHGNITEENIITDDGAPDLSYGYVRKVFEYSSDGNVSRETLYDADATVISIVEHSEA
jgi:hypothetical protein